MNYTCIQLTVEDGLATLTDLKQAGLVIKINIS